MGSFLDRNVACIHMGFSKARIGEFGHGFEIGNRSFIGHKDVFKAGALKTQICIPHCL